MEVDDLQAELRAMEQRLDRGGGGTAAELVDLVRGLEELRNTVAAVQMIAIVRLVEQQTLEDLEAGVPEEQAGTCTASQVALARRQPPRRGVRDVHLAQRLADELPACRQALLEGRASEYQAELVDRHSRFLGPEDRARVDELMAPELEHLSARQVAARVKTHAYRIDPVGYTRNAALAHEDRRVGMRPTPDTMALVTAYLPAPQAVAVWGALDRAARAARAAGDERSLDQVRADVLVERVTGQARADAVPLEVQLVTPAGTAFGNAEVLQALTSADEPATLSGYGPIPAPMARDLIRVPRRLGCGRCWPTRSPGSWSAGPAGAGCSRRATGTCSSRGTGPAGRRTATRPSGRRTTWSPGPAGDRPAPATVRGCAPSATRPGTIRAGRRNPSRRVARNRPAGPASWPRPGSTPARPRS